MRKTINLLRCVVASNMHRLASPYKVTFALTYRCNLKCKICSIWKHSPAKELGVDEIGRIFRNFVNLSWIDLTGGEVTLREDVLEVIKVIARSAKKMLIFHISTNGQSPERAVLMAREVLRARLVPVINVSIDGPRTLHDQLRGVQGAFDKGVETFRQLKGMKRGHYYLSCTISKYNVNQVDAMIAELKERIPGLSYSDVHFNLFHVSSHYYQNQGAGETAGLKTDEIKKYFSLSRQGGVGKAFLENEYIKGLDTFLAEKKPPVKCQALNATCFIDPQGEVYPCGIYNQAVGGLLDSEYDIDRIWRGPRTAIVREKIEKRHCPGCWSPCEAYPAILGSLIR